MAHYLTTNDGKNYARIYESGGMVYIESLTGHPHSGNVAVYNPRDNTTRVCATGALSKGNNLAIHVPKPW